jgi:hypothetical protein
MPERKDWGPQFLRPMSDAELEAFYAEVSESERIAHPLMRRTHRKRRVAVERELRRRGRLPGEG